MRPGDRVAGQAKRWHREVFLGFSFQGNFTGRYVYPHNIGQPLLIQSSTAPWITQLIEAQADFFPAVMRCIVCAQLVKQCERFRGKKVTQGLEQLGFEHPPGRDARIRKIRSGRRRCKVVQLAQRFNGRLLPFPAPLQGRLALSLIPVPRCLLGLTTQRQIRCIACVPILETLPMAEHSLMSHCINSRLFVAAFPADQDALVDQLLSQNQSSFRQITLDCTAAHHSQRNTRFIIALLHAGDGQKQT